MGPKRLGNDFRSIDVKCADGHRFAKYRKPKAEQGHQTHKLWLIDERIGRLVTEPPLLDDEGFLVEELPETGAHIQCGFEGCERQVGEIAMIKGTVALELNKQETQRAKG